jgi:hypothetical protein
MTVGHVAVLAAVAGVLASCASKPAGSPSTGIDHVVLAISNLDRGVAQLGETCGVTPVPGGSHEHTGTENALLSMGSGAYLEVLAPQAGKELPAELQPLRAVSDLTPVSWAVSTANADLTIRMLRAHGYTVGEPQAAYRRRTHPLANVPAARAADRGRAVLHRVGCLGPTSGGNFAVGLPVSVPRIADSAG